MAKNLKTLRLKSSKLTNIACLINLPDSIEILDLSYNRFETLLVNNNGDFLFSQKFEIFANGWLQSFATSNN